MIYLFHGDDAFSSAEAARGLRARMEEEDPMAALNSTALSGARLSVAELQAAADALPFLGERRLVTVEGLLGRLNPRGGDRSAERRKALADGLKAYLPGMPASTRLVLVEGALHGNNPLLTWLKKRAAQDGESVLLRAFERPKASAMPGWIRQRAERRGGALSAPAAAALAEALARDGQVDLRLADAEVEKLLTYADDREVTEQDVALLVTPIGLESIFRLMDALAERRGAEAASLLHRFFEEGEPPLRILALVTRQIRLLALTRALLNEGTPPRELQGRLPVPPFVARKLASQARRFDLAFLTGALGRLLEIDEGAKTGRVDPVLGLELFVARVCGLGAPAR